MEQKIKEFIGDKATYDNFGQKIWGNKNGNVQILADLRGWGAIQNLFMDNKGFLSQEGLKNAEKFQDELGEWIVDAINQKLQNEKMYSKEELKQLTDAVYYEEFSSYNEYNDFIQKRLI